jgi:pyruvate formate lyase activating enzyme
MARRIAGKYYSPVEISGIVLRDKLFYETSEGGVTFSGGEPLLFMDYLKDILEILKKEDVHITVETCGNFDFQKFEKKLLPLVDLILYDIKMMDPIKHKEYTGKSNETIIRNFKELLNKDVEILPRIPLVPEYTATKENLSQIARFFKQLNIKEYGFLAYNPSGKEKWVRLGKSAPENLSEKPMILKEEEGWIKFFKNKMRNLNH